MNTGYHQEIQFLVNQGTTKDHQGPPGQPGTSWTTRDHWEFPGTNSDLHEPQRDHHEPLVTPGTAGDYQGIPLLGHLGTTRDTQELLGTSRNHKGTTRDW